VDRPRPDAGKKRSDVVSLHVPKRLLERIDELVERGLFTSRSEALRFAIVLLLRETYKLSEERREVGYR
jgi:Arc/MetJ-type ribon-helix-helix transcriptional regulator